MVVGAAGAEEFGSGRRAAWSGREVGLTGECGSSLEKEEMVFVVLGLRTRCGGAVSGRDLVAAAKSVFALLGGGNATPCAAPEDERGGLLGSEEDCWYDGFWKRLQARKCRASTSSMSRFCVGHVCALAMR